MTKQTYFIRDILSAQYWIDLTDPQRESLSQYFADLQSGPADGEMDIEWQESQRGYYHHLAKLAQLEGQAKTDYIDHLLDDISICLTIWPGNYIVERVADQVRAFNTTQNQEE